jgi:hypothetical protein
MLILAGVAQSGKTKTLRQITLAQGFKELERNLFEFNGKLICIYFGSPQEIPPDRPTDFKGIMRIVNARLKKCEAQNSDLIIMAFQIRGIEKPLEYLASLYEIHLAYMRKASAVSVDKNDALMKALGAEEITSQQDYAKQADALWTKWKGYF